MKKQERSEAFFAVLVVIVALLLLPAKEEGEKAASGRVIRWLVGLTAVALSVYYVARGLVS